MGHAACIAAADRPPRSNQLGGQPTGWPVIGWPVTGRPAGWQNLVGLIWSASLVPSTLMLLSNALKWPQ